MPDLLDVLSQQIGGGAVQQISNQLGAEPAATQQAIEAALPVLIGGLARNANRSASDADSLASALDRDHDGSLLDHLGSILGGGGAGALGGLLGGGGGGLGGLIGAVGSVLGGNKKAVDGDGILGHVLGGKRDAVEKGVSKASGLDIGKVSQLLVLLAPVVMSALGKVKQQRGLDANGVTAVLNRERAAVEEQAPGVGKGGLLGILDADNDGQIADDIGRLGSVLGGLLGGR